jgi:ComF family protein
MGHSLQKYGNHLVDFILPPLCPATGEMVDMLGMVDPKFWQSLNFINAPLCQKCGSPFAFEAEDMTCGECLENPPLYHQNRSALAYDDGSRSMILRFKHGDQIHAVKAFIPWLRQVGQELLSDADIMIPVPLHRMRLIKRRYNQADIIGRELVNYYPNITYYPDALLRIKNTMSQGHKKAKDRKKNVFRAFQTNPIYNYEDKNIVMIDDVYTTGATLNECAKMLYRAGAKEVNCLTLAKVVKF